MISLRQITRSLGWSPASDDRSSDVKKSRRPSPAGRQVQVFDNVIRLPNRLDASLHPAVILAATNAYAQGHPVLVLDLGEVEQLGTAGIFTLHAVAMVMRGQTPPDPEGGWQALRTVVEANLAVGRQERLVALRPSPAILARLRANQLDRCLVIAH